EHLAALLEHLAHAVAGPQVDVAAPITLLLVCEAVPLLRRRRDGLREQLHLARPQRRLALLRVPELAGDGDLIATVEQFALRPPFRELVALQPDLDAPRAVLHRSKDQLAEVARR